VRKIAPRNLNYVARQHDRSDPEASAVMLEKATVGHHTLLVALQKRLGELDVSPETIVEDKRGFDLFARGTIFEAKTSTPANLHEQVRLGVGQLLDYAAATTATTTQCVVLDRRLGRRQKRLLEFVDIGCVLPRRLFDSPSRRLFDAHRERGTRGFTLFDAHRGRETEVSRSLMRNGT
jgi:hypothetical protein